MPLTPSPPLHTCVHKLCTQTYIHLFMPLMCLGPVGSPPGELTGKEMSSMRRWSDEGVPHSVHSWILEDLVTMPF